MLPHHIKITLNSISAKETFKKILCSYKNEVQVLLAMGKPNFKNVF